MKKKSNKKATLESVSDSIDALAVITKRGFDNAHNELKEFKEEMHEFKDKTEKSIFELSSDMVDVKERVKNIENTLGPVLSMTEALKVNWRNHESRLSHLERKLGISK